jgi:hypothetical protein
MEKGSEPKEKVIGHMFSFEGHFPCLPTSNLKHLQSVCVVTLLCQVIQKHGYGTDTSC